MKRSGAVRREEAYILVNSASASQEDDCACPSTSIALSPETAPGGLYRQRPVVFAEEIAQGVKVFFCSMRSKVHWF